MNKVQWCIHDFPLMGEGYHLILLKLPKKTKTNEFKEDILSKSPSEVSILH